MTYLTIPRHYDQPSFRALTQSLTWDYAWTPAFPTLHNTGAPSLRQYLAYSPNTKEQWAGNLDRYYKSLGWHSGPHLVCCPAYIWNLCDLQADGVSVSCWNHLTIGIEMVGDYSPGADDPNSPEGKATIDNAVWALACLADKLKWNLRNISLGHSGLHFHRECIHDHHACPGSLISKDDILNRVDRVLAGWKSAPAAVAVAAPKPATGWYWAFVYASWQIVELKNGIYFWGGESVVPTRLGPAIPRPTNLPE
jgi:N-acetylmuramoyl-L-alanine amidase